MTPLDWTPLRPDQLDAFLPGASPAMRLVRQRILHASRVPVPVLIQGETGTGKELVARAVHRLSSAAGKPFVAINCASLPESLAESELFGHERGAFTGAHGNRTGRIAAAAGGTLFLDEIEDMSLPMQARLLRFLSAGEVQRVGADHALQVTTRVITASNVNLWTLVAQQRFRTDLYYRLNVLSINVPPLRERPEDLPELIRILSARISAELKMPVSPIEDELMQRLSSALWHGNVRELENYLRRRAVLHDEGEGTWDAVPEVLPARAPAGGAGLRHDVAQLSLLLHKYGGNIAQVARVLRLTRQAVWKRVRRAGLDPRRFRGAGSAADEPPRESVASFADR
jgi:DNA-binding NtrC family response regulator